MYDVHVQNRSSHHLDAQCLKLDIFAATSPRPLFTLFFVPSTPRVSFAESKIYWSPPFFNFCTT